MINILVYTVKNPVDLYFFGQDGTAQYSAYHPTLDSSATGLDKLIENVHTDSERAVGIDVLEFLIDTLP